MADTISDQTLILGGGTRNIQFRPSQPGPINIQSVATDPPLHSESGFLGWLNLLNPAGKIVATERTKVGKNQNLLTVTFQTTAADLTAPGQWTCQVANGTEVNLTFTTRITNVGSTPLKTASFDVGMLNVLLANITAAAQFTINIGNGVGVLAWSSAFAAFLNNQTLTSFQVANQPAGPYNIFSFGLEGFSLQPGFPVLQFLTTPLVFRLTLLFNPGATLKAESAGTQDVHIQSFKLTADLDLNGFLQVTCDTKATHGGVVGTLDTGDPSDDLKNGVESAIRTEIDKTSTDANGNPVASPLSPDVLKPQIDRIFKLLMRLGVQATVNGYTANGDTLVVSYRPPPSVSVVNPESGGLPVSTVVSAH